MYVCIWSFFLHHNTLELLSYSSVTTYHYLPFPLPRQSRPLSSVSCTTFHRSVQVETFVVVTSSSALLFSTSIKFWYILFSSFENSCNLPCDFFNTLVILISFQTLVNFPAFFLLLTCSFIPLCSEKILDMVYLIEFFLLTIFILAKVDDKPFTIVF